MALLVWMYMISLVVLVGAGSMLCCFHGPCWEKN